jgi:hypothetical protein
MGKDVGVLREVTKCYVLRNAGLGWQEGTVRLGLIAACVAVHIYHYSGGGPIVNIILEYLYLFFVGQWGEAAVEAGTLSWAVCCGRAAEPRIAIRGLCGGRGVEKFIRGRYFREGQAERGAFRRFWDGLWGGSLASGAVAGFEAVVVVAAPAVGGAERAADGAATFAAFEMGHDDLSELFARFLREFCLPVPRGVIEIQHIDDVVDQLIDRQVRVAFAASANDDVTQSRARGHRFPEKIIGREFACLGQ